MDFGLLRLIMIIFNFESFTFNCRCLYISEIQVHIFMLTVAFTPYRETMYGGECFFSVTKLLLTDLFLSFSLLTDTFISQNPCKIVAKITCEFCHLPFGGWIFIFLTCFTFKRIYTYKLIFLSCYCTS